MVAGAERQAWMRRQNDDLVSLRLVLPGKGIDRVLLSANLGYGRGRVQADAHGWVPLRGWRRYQRNQLETETAVKGKSRCAGSYCPSRCIRGISTIHHRPRSAICN